MVLSGPGPLRAPFLFRSHGFVSWGRMRVGPLVHPSTPPAEPFHRRTKGGLPAAPGQAADGAGFSRMAGGSEGLASTLAAAVAWR